ncbi:hypothetical protein AAur_2805 [Paenarthrobacter aurescens TC1]|uniref:Uncharacterized protein n=2 Tax=Paenarthrobacter aurescens TaxID=43663 RepID=A1R8F4_PAEAT|nr:hypothetical protein AAur_2805 [Paenarthrobacter aurescens TC1]
MSRDPIPQAAGEGHQHNSGTGEATGEAPSGASVNGSTLPAVTRMPPAHWSFWSYLWRYSLRIGLPVIALGMFFGYLDSTGYELPTDPEMVANIAVFGVMFGGLSQIIAFVVALAAFIIERPARRQWAAYRGAGWTTSQCRSAYSLHKREAAALRLDSRLRELGLAPVQPQAALTPSPQKNLSKMDRLWAWLAIPLCAFLVFVLVGPWLDTKDVQTLQCEVVSAEPGTNSGGTRGGASTASVLVKTSNCGTLGISRGVSFDNRDEVASSFTIGATYGFDVGWYSRTFFKNNIQSVRAYRLIA